MAYHRPHPPVHVPFKIDFDNSLPYDMVRVMNQNKAPYNIAPGPGTGIEVLSFSTDDELSRGGTHQNVEWTVASYATNPSDTIGAMSWWNSDYYVWHTGARIVIPAGKLPDAAYWQVCYGWWMLDANTGNIDTKEFDWTTTYDLNSTSAKWNTYTFPLPSKIGVTATITPIQAIYQGVTLQVTLAASSS